MIQWIPAIKNRSQSDIDRVKELLAKNWENMTELEKSEWLSGMKGAFNISDMARIENNVQLLSDVLELGLITFVNNLPEIPNSTYFTQLRANIATIRSAYAIHTTTPNVPEQPINDYIKINAIEQILSDVHDILLSNFYYYCGTEIYAGNSTGLLL